MSFIANAVTRSEILRYHYSQSEYLEEHIHLKIYIYNLFFKKECISARRS